MTIGIFTILPMFFEHVIIKLSFPKIITTLYNVANIRLFYALQKTLPRPSFKGTCILTINQLKHCTKNIFGDIQTDHPELQ